MKIILCVISGFLVLTTSKLEEVQQNYPSGVPKDKKGKARQLANELFSKQLSSSTLIQPSSQCWLTAITALENIRSSKFIHHNDDVEHTKNIDSLNPSSDASISIYCASMTEEEKEILAMELTQCQLRKGNRPLFKRNDMQDHSSGSDHTVTNVLPEKRSFFPTINIDQNEYYDVELPKKNELVSPTTLCPIGNPDLSHHKAPYNIHSCLPLLSNDAWNLYNIFFVHIVSVCRHLTEEIMKRQKEETTHRLIQASTVLEDSAYMVVHHLNAQTSLLQSQSHFMREQRHDFEQWHQALKHAERELFQSVKGYAKEALGNIAAQWSIQSSLLQDQSRLMKEQQIHLDKIFQRYIKAEKEALENVKKHERGVLDSVKEQLEEVVKVMKEKEERALKKQEEIEKIHKPLSTIGIYLKIATDGFTAFTSFLNCVISVNVMWIMTIVPLLSRLRRCLFGIFIFGFLAELTVVLEFIKGSGSFLGGRLIRDYTDFSGKDSVVSGIRFLTRVLAIATLVLFLLVSCFIRLGRYIQHYSVPPTIDCQMELHSEKKLEGRSYCMEGLNSPCPTKASSIHIVTPSKNKKTEKTHSVVKVTSSKMNKGRQKCNALPDRLKENLNLKKRIEYRSSISSNAIINGMHCIRSSDSQRLVAKKRKRKRSESIANNFYPEHERDSALSCHTNKKLRYSKILANKYVASGQSIISHCTNVNEEDHSISSVSSSLSSFKSALSVMSL